MKLLLDTHTVLWALGDAERLSRGARQEILDGSNELWLSTVSYWEIHLKISVGMLELGEGWLGAFRKECAENQIRWLHVEPQHCERLGDLDWHHRDPFDRMLVAQAAAEDLTIITKDENIWKYAVKCLW